ncbi:MAG: L-aspartate oxidase [Gammaproteobacteria bacterium]|nr:L-aspartate oxidase [Gammaproteobacteria bacterium]
MQQRKQTDVLIIGSGAAGLSLALQLPRSLDVTVTSKSDLSAGSTTWAQGGVSAVLDESDSLESHIEDTLAAGAGLCDRQVVTHVVERGPAAVERLIELGVEFTRGDSENEFHLTREGGHTHRRVIHAGDTTGRAIQQALESAVRGRDNIKILENHLAVDLVTTGKLGLPGNRCVGAYLLDIAAQEVVSLPAKCVVVATGGASKAYLYSSNPDSSTGDGIAMAWRAGCRLANLEFMQFHPTCLYHPQAKSFLITEALRGEGAKLLLPDGTAFIEKFDPRGELAPRDIVARAIDHEMKRLGAEYVLLDISHKPADFIKKHFPNVHARCLDFGFDITAAPIPVVPAAHYTCGGVITDINGRTDLAYLYAIGEVAFTGLHGANRMASNSLLECLVFATNAADDIATQLRSSSPPPELPGWDESRVTDSDEEVVVSHNWNELRHFMWDYVGIVRTNKRLERAQHRVELLQSEIAEYYGNFKITGDLIELRNLAVVSDLIVTSAMRRKESRGLHYTLDYPEPNNASPPRNTILVPPNFAGNSSQVRWNY